MTLLTICQEAAKTVGLRAPSTIVGNTDLTAVRLLAAVSREGKVLSRMKWKVLLKEYTFSTVNGTAAYAFPADFQFGLHDTAWNRTQAEKMFGPMSPQMWQEYKSGLVTSGIVDSFRVKVDSGEKKIFIDPTPTAVETIAYEYISNEWCESSGGAAQSDWAADADVGRLDEFLLELGTTWRLMKMFNLPYFEEKFEYDREVEKAFGRDGFKRTLNLARTHLRDTFVGVTPETGYGS